MSIVNVVKGGCRSAESIFNRTKVRATVAIRENKTSRTIPRRLESGDKTVMNELLSRTCIIMSAANQCSPENTKYYFGDTCTRENIL